MWLGLAIMLVMVVGLIWWIVWAVRGKRSKLSEDRMELVGGLMKPQSFVLWLL